jgi:hypothetical protein
VLELETILIVARIIRSLFFIQEMLYLLSIYM